MSTILQIRYIRIKTDGGWQDPYDLDHPVVAIVGPVDTGKSSLVDCIAFALGRDNDDFRGAVDVHLREVEIGIRVGTGSYILRRSRKRNSYVVAFDPSRTLVGRFPVRIQDNAPQGEQTLSSWLLEQLELDDSFSSVRLQGDRTLDFANSLLPYCYLIQDDIDRFIIRPSREDAVRLVVLKLLLNLTTPEYERSIAAIHDIGREIEKRRRQINVIRNFLIGSSATNPDRVNRELIALSIARDAAAGRLAKWRKDPNAAVHLEDCQRRKLEAARFSFAEAEMQLDHLKRKYACVCATLVSCEDGLKALRDFEDRRASEPLMLHIPLTQCPSCNSSISDRPVREGCCYLCGEDLTGKSRAAEHDRLQKARAQATADEIDLRVKVQGAAERTDIAAGIVSALLAELGNESSGSMTPFVEAIATATAEVAELNARSAILTRVQEGNNRLDEQLRGISDLEANQNRLRENADRHSVNLERADDVLSDLNEIFQRIVRDINLPHATGQARLDPETLLPLVDEQKFSQRGGGAKSAVSIAYSLTLLTYTLGNALAKLPALLIIDSPRKNLGFNEDDQGLARRVYERFLDQMADRRNLPDKFHRPYQLIIVDNDLHAEMRQRVKVYEFKHDQGFIRQLTFPHGRAKPTVQLSLEDETDGWPHA